MGKGGDGHRGVRGKQVHRGQTIAPVVAEPCRPVLPQLPLAEATPVAEPNPVAGHPPVAERLHLVAAVLVPELGMLPPPLAGTEALPCSHCP